MVLLYHILGLIILVGLLLGVIQTISLFEDLKEKRLDKRIKSVNEIPRISQEELERLKLIKNREEKINKLLR